MTRWGNRLSNGPLSLMAAALFAVTGLAATNPMMAFVDCSDSFWAIACEMEPNPAAPGNVIVGELVTIDSDPICVVLDNGYIVCHT